MKSTLMVILLLFLVVNVGVLYYMVLFGDIPRLAARVDLAEQRIDSLIKRDGREITPEVKVGGETGDLVVLSDQQKSELVSLTLAGADRKLDALVESKVAGSVSEAAASQPSAIKEFFVPLGNATVRTDNYTWTTTAAQAEIDLGNYGTVKAVTFEATLRVPSGNGQVEARLYNSSTGGVVGGSELSGDGAGGVFRKSGSLVLTGGNNSYKVQMRTSQNYDGVMDGGRIRIVVQ